MRIWLAGGGSAGHVLPLSALASELARLGHESVLIIDQSRTAQLIAQEGGEWSQVFKVRSGKFRRYEGRSWGERLVDARTLVLNLRDALWVVIGLLQALWRMIFARPDAVFINGGSVGVPVAWAARLFKVPYLIHESDTEPGLANRLVAKRARRVLFGFPPSEKAKEHIGTRVFVTGIPARPEFVAVKKLKSKDLKQKHGFDSNLPLVLITGGSAGSERLNRLLLAAAEKLTSYTEVIHIAGDGHASSVQGKATSRGVDPRRYHVFGYVGPNMPEFLQAADVVISRSGATILSDLAYLGKTVILIPNPHLARHQSNNARLFDDAGAALVLSEVELAKDPGLLTSELEKLLKDTPRRRKLAKNIAGFAHPNATAQITQHVVEVAAEAAGEQAS